MSKLELQKLSYESSGVSYEESMEMSQLEPPMSIYDRIGKEDGCLLLSQLFYNNVFNDRQAAWFLNIFASSTKDEAIDNQFRFFVQTFGGPDLYRQKKGKYTRLVGRHAAYTIGIQAADRWLEHMKNAIDNHEHLRQDKEASSILMKYFQYTAHYIVHASTYMRDDQLSGGTQIDTGRIW